MKIVLDTNVILSSISPHSPYRVIFDKFEKGEYTLCLTTEILLEYEEKLASNFSPKVAELTIGAMLLKSNVQFTEVYFKWQLIYRDLDDNKFIDSAIASNAHYLVTNDKHFNILKSIQFPRIRVLRMTEFIEILQSQ